MNNQSGFDLFETSTPTNEDVHVIFTPALDVVKYQYQIINKLKILIKFR